ncbi:transglycosylase SLT domain-containing protein [Burkholderia gladioli]|uniref:lytic transglycosylase domain-containing protein n=1 Tax=Burkholderia gladioli TaxID=28095 RepID=UPI001906BB20|nr:transglycosylase SLT domain-containing protein [Burkholderia gladioli]MBJ9709884.1 lytic transglycosylase domain-containing protein [Burkholderia gladioli]MCH7275036.1 transglycosylase SLT domain-containing protein [Burkholderia gladioli]
MPIDPLYEDSTNAYLAGLGGVALPAAPTPNPSTGFGSVARAVGRGLGQGGAALAGAAADTGAAVGTLTTAPDSLTFDPLALAASDQQENAARAKAGRLFESPTGTAAYSFSDSLKPDPTNTTRIDQIVQGAVSGLTQIIPASVLLGPAAGAVVGGLSIGMARSEDLKREGVDIGTRTAVGAVDAAVGALGARLPAGGNTLLKTAGLVGVGGPGLAIGQGAAERAILRNAGYDHLANQIDPLDGTNLAAATLMASVFGGVHAVGVARAGRAANTPVDPATPLPSLDVAARKALPYNSPVLDAYATQVAQQNGVPPALLLFIKNRGEMSNSEQVSSAGAKGVMQFTKDTWAAYGRGDPQDPVNSIDAAGRYAKDLMQRYDGNMRAAVTEYNGGVEQARAVAAGGKPTSKETIGYLGRFDDYVANHAADDFRFNPTPDQVDAALTARGQRIVDDAYVFGTPDDVNGMALHQDAFEAAARQMDEAGFPDMTRFYTPDDATRAATLDGLIADAEAQHADLSTAAANLADPGSIAAARGELDTLNAGAPDTSPAAVKELTRQIQGQGVKFKAAQRQAQQQIDALQADYEARVTRLQGVVRQNAEAQRATQQLGALDSQLAALREQRAAIDVPATRRTQLADFVSRIARAQRETPDVPDAPRADAIAAAARETPPGAPEAGNAPPSATSAPGYESSIDAGLRDAAAINPDLEVTIDTAAGEQTGRLADIVQQIDDEHAKSAQKAQLLNVAANCFITTLG